MFARNKETTEVETRTERTRIVCTSHIGSVFVSQPAGGPRRGGGERDLVPADTSGRVQCRWRIVLAIGPMRAESEANGVCRLWSLSQRGIASKVARGEAIAIRLDIPGFVDWDFVFGARDRLGQAYRLQFCKNPCAASAAPAVCPLVDDRKRQRKKRRRERGEIM